MANTTSATHIKASRFNGFLPACDNPVNIERVTTLPFMLVKFDWDYHFESLAQLNFRAAIVGPMGSGKTTLMNELTNQLNERKYKTHQLFLPHESNHHREMIKCAIRESLSNHKIVLVDGIERISMLQRHHLYRKTKQSAGLIINVHKPCRLPTWYRCSTSPDLMCKLLTRLGLDQPSIQTAGQVAFSKHNGNIRLALRDLYDQFSSGEFNSILSR